jgi:ATP-binding cassette, subfamily F, member 3
MIPDLRGIVSLKNISVHFNGEFLFNGISFLVNPRDRIGLVGKNGAGIGKKGRHIH